MTETKLPTLVVATLHQDCEPIEMPRELRLNTTDGRNECQDSGCGGLFPTDVRSRSEKSASIVSLFLSLHMSFPSAV